MLRMLVTRVSNALTNPLLYATSPTRTPLTRSCNPSLRSVPFSLIAQVVVHPKMLTRACEEGFQDLEEIKLITVE